MKKNVLINLIYSGLLALVGIVNLIIAFIAGDNGDIFFFVFCTMIALLLMSAGQILNVATKYADYVFSKVAKFWLNLAGVIGKYLSIIIGILGAVMGLYTVGSSYQDYGFNTEEYQMMLIVLVIIWIALTILGLTMEIFSRSTDSVSSNITENKSYSYSDMVDIMNSLQGNYPQIKGWQIIDYDGRIIEVICHSADVIYLEKVFAKRLPANIEIRFKHNSKI